MTCQVADVELIVNQLLAYLVGKVQRTFVASGLASGSVLTDVSYFDGLAKGLPVFGENVPAGAFILEFDAGADTVTLSEQLIGDVTAGTFQTGFQTTGRRVKHWTQVEAQPAFFLRHTGDDDVFDGEGLGKTTVDLEGWIYSKAGSDPNAVPDTALNYLARSIRQALVPDDADSGEFTLGGMVYHCRIEGRSEFDPGDQDSQGKALIPIRILLP